MLVEGGELGYLDGRPIRFVGSEFWILHEFVAIIFTWNLFSQRLIHHQLNILLPPSKMDPNRTQHPSKQHPAYNRHSR